MRIRTRYEISTVFLFCFSRAPVREQQNGRTTMSLKKKPKEDDHEALAGEESAVAGDLNNIVYYGRYGDNNNNNRDVLTAQRTFRTVNDGDRRKVDRPFFSENSNSLCEHVCSLLFSNISCAPVLYVYC